MIFYSIDSESAYSYAVAMYFAIINFYGSTLTASTTYFYGRTSRAVQTANHNNPAGVFKYKYNSPRPLKDFNYFL
jgi:hypothetical protein